VCLKGLVKKPCFKLDAMVEDFEIVKLTVIDIVERFHIFVESSVIVVQNMKAAVFGWNELIAVVIVCLSEVLVDAVKHAFVCKFNNIKFTLFQRFREKLCEDLAQNRPQAVSTDAAVQLMYIVLLGQHKHCI
jgi:hypothetical protein